MITLVVAVIGAGAGFISGYLSARWLARNDLAQWRRDRLLQYCSDILTVSNELFAARPAPGVPGNSTPPIETLRQLNRALYHVMLLGDELMGPANAYVDAAINVANSRFRNPGANHDAATRKFGRSQGLFLRAAHDHLRDFPNRQNLGWPRVDSYLAEIWARVGTYVADAVAPASSVRRSASATGSGTPSSTIEPADTPGDTAPPP